MADLDAAVNPYLVHPFHREAEWRTLATETEAGGLGIRRQKWQAPRHRFRLRVVYRTAAAAAAFEAFFAARKGGRAGFSWTCPQDNVVYTCRFAQDRLALVWEGPERWEYGFELLGVAQ
jgi:phage-related protein